MFFHTLQNKNRKVYDKHIYWVAFSKLLCFDLVLLIFKLLSPTNFREKQGGGVRGAAGKLEETRRDKC